MKEIIDDILNERFVYDRGALAFEPSRLELRTTKNEPVESAFTIYGAEGLPIDGRVLCGDPRMELAAADFHGNGESCAFRYDTEGLREGVVVNGVFDVLSNQGEYALPYTITIGRKTPESSMGPVRNLFHFVNLAKTNWQEALRLFYSPDFDALLSGADKQYEKMYRCLSANYMNEQNMDEFLVALHKKQSVAYLTEEKEILLDAPEDGESGVLRVTKNGWGYVRLAVECDAPFLEFAADVLTEEDFLGSVTELRYIVRADALHAGVNYGVLRLKSSFDTLEIVFRVQNGKGRHPADIKQRESRRERKRCVLELMRAYEAFRAKKTARDAWIVNSSSLLERMLLLNDGDMTARLFQAQLFITEKRNGEAGWVLSGLRDAVIERGDTATQCYYDYLLSLNNRGDELVTRAEKQVTEAFEEEPDNWRIAWLLLYLSEEYGKSPSKRWMLMEREFSFGARSPIVYLEAFMLLQANPSLLTSLDEFSMQILYYGAKKHLLTPDLIRQIAYLAEGKKEYSRLLEEILKEAYVVSPADETLRVLCLTLMRGAKKGAAYFPYYSEAVDRELRITGLFEYYMLSLDLSERRLLPKTVYLYFTYGNKMEYRYMAYLYATVWEHREEIPEIHESYGRQMEEFLLAQIEAEHMNVDLAYLYKTMFDVRHVDTRTAKSMAKLLFMNRLRISGGPEVKRVLIYRSRETEELSVPVRANEAFFPVYGGDDTILFEDASGNRYLPDVSYTLEKFMLPGKIAKLIAPFVEDDISFDIYLCESTGTQFLITKENRKPFERLLRSEKAEPSLRLAIGEKLLPFYFENEMLTELDECLAYLVSAEFDEREKKEIVSLAVTRGMYAEAYAVMEKHGASGISPKDVLKTADALLEKAKDDEDFIKAYPAGEALLLSAFKSGKYSASSLTYLIRRHRGRVKELRDVWREGRAFAAKVVAGRTDEFSKDMRALEERILLQLLYSGAYIGEAAQVFVSCREHGGNPALLRAFLYRELYDYFVKDKLVGDMFFSEAYDLAKRDGTLPYVGKLALLKYYAERGEERNGEVSDLLKEYLREIMLGEHKYLSCFQAYAGSFEESAFLSDKTIVEYKAHPRAKVRLHYAIGSDLYGEEETENPSAYRTESLLPVYEGVYSRAFVLFFGEKLQYYITEETDGEELPTVSDTLVRGDAYGETHESRFGAVNDIAVGVSLRDYDTVDDLMYEYKKKEFLAESLFRLR